ncbi:hypothetical protein V2O64_00860 [Verrucomicrobiaceae bacterium 227]
MIKDKGIFVHLELPGRSDGLNPVVQLVATSSESRRRVKGNGSLGTDHGTASQAFLVTPEGHKKKVSPASSVNTPAPTLKKKAT